MVKAGVVVCASRDEMKEFQEVGIVSSIAFLKSESDVGFSCKARRL